MNECDEIPDWVCIECESGNMGNQNYCKDCKACRYPEE